ncbi:MAG: N-formylglutamate amidohydrolase [Gammaproteobacteria bacterium]|nr:N-formylglutamate amidohydrolase [Gammaproteobacteria bacterium]
MGLSLILSCEHGGNDVPAQYRALFRGRAAERALAGHLGSDTGSLTVARALSAHFGVSLFSSTVTRLLVDLNRSLGHRRLFSPFSQKLDAAQRHGLLARYYLPYRAAVTQAVAEGTRGDQRVLHVSVHSFTPKLGRRCRTADIGLLYDPARTAERQLCAAWKAELDAVGGGLRVRRNYPYRGAADGLTTHLRGVFASARYLGIELELNQNLLAERPEAAVNAVAASLDNLLGSQSPGCTKSGVRAPRNNR